MDLNKVDISRLPSDVKKDFLKLQVMYAERKIQAKAKDDFLSFVKSCAAWQFECLPRAKPCPGARSHAPTAPHRSCSGAQLSCPLSTGATAGLQFSDILWVLNNC